MKNINKILIFLILLSAIISIDLIAKGYFDYKVLNFIDGFISIDGNAHNYGAGFSILQNAIVFFVILACLFIGAFILYEIKTKDRRKSWLYYISASLILGGTIGNMIDRIAFGYVRDFIKLEFINFPIFNIADSALTIGVILIAIYLIFIYSKEEKSNNEVKQNDNEKIVNQEDNNA